MQDNLPSDRLAAQVLQASRAMFVAGCCFDELPPAVIMEAVHSHRSTGGAVFFDPGPRSLTFRDPDRKKALHALLDSTDVVLMTQVSFGGCPAGRLATITHFVIRI